MRRSIKKKRLIHENTSLARFLFEQEEDVFADVEEETEEEPADEGGEDAPADDAAADEGADEGGEGEGEGDEEEEDEKLDVDPEEEVKLTKSVDQDLEALLIDFEAQARKSKDIEAASEDIVIEQFHLGMLLEQDEVAYEDEIDLDRFTAEVARLIKNYTTLLDMEKMLLNKAREFVLTRYGEEAEQEMLSQLEVKHDIEIVAPSEPIDTELEVPIAVGAGAGAAGGAA